MDAKWVDIFQEALSQHAPGLLLSSHLYALTRLLVAKGLFTQEELSAALWIEFRQMCEPIEPPGTIIIPGPNIDLTGGKR